MTTDIIAEIGIDNMERLYIVPRTITFPMIYRTATEVHWDSHGKFLYSPKPRDWDYADWYKHILGVAHSECGCKLMITADTKWVNVPDDLRDKIVNT